MSIPVESFNTLDDDLVVDGAWADAFTLRGLITNTNHLLANGMRRLVNKAWDINDPFDVHALGWTRILPHFYVKTSPRADLIRVKIRAKIANTKTVYLMVSTNRRSFTARIDPTTEGKALVGDGTIKTYPTAGTYTIPIKPNSFECITIYMSSAERTAIGDKNGDLYGLIAEVDDNYVRCFATAGPPTYADFSALTPPGTNPWMDDYYLYASSDTAGTQLVSPTRRIKFFSGAGGVFLVYGWAANERPRPYMHYWRMCQGISLELYSVSIYEQELTEL